MPADIHAMLGLAIVNGNIFGYVIDRLYDPIGRYFYDMIIFKTATGSGKQLQRLRMQDFHADLLQDVQRSPMNFVFIVI